MACDQVIIVYSTNQNLRRRVIYPETTACIRGLVVDLAEGESYFIANTDDYEYYGPDALVGWFTMSIPRSDRCLLVSSGVVLDVIRADPAIDTHPEGKLIQDDLAGAGWEQKEDGSFHKPVEATVKFVGVGTFE